MGWKIYFWFITPLMVLVTAITLAGSLGFLLLDEWAPTFEEYWNWLDWLSLLITWVGIVGLFGFAYKKVLGEQNFWKRWFIFNLIFEISYAVFEYFPEEFVAEDVWSAVLGYSLFLPYYIALYLYGYKSDSLWNPQSTPPQ
jgi:hypothetical protein